MTRAIDIICNDFTPNGIRKNYIENEEEHSRFEQVGRAQRVQSFEVSEFKDRMDKLGVEKVFVAAIKTWSVQSQALLEHTTTKEVIDITKAAPDCIYGLYGINVHRGMKDVSELEQAVRENGFIGAHLHPHGYGYPPDHAYYFPFYAKCQELGVPVIVSMGHTLDLMPIEPGRPIHLDKVALYFQDLNIVCTHTGWPWVEEAIALAWKHPNVFLGTSAYTPKIWKPEMVKFINTFGSDKCMWGTDFPLIDHQESLEQIEALNLSESSMDKFLYSNAARVFGLD